MADPLECLGGILWERWGSASTFPQDGSTWECLAARQDTQSAPRARAVNCLFIDADAVDASFGRREEEREE
eukprot:2231035-Pyramimonas_sp.AAC.1